tara:strand:- start:12 stop:593 length:582 start_codon:yes stop_codon:yes gene_type:complete
VLPNLSINYRKYLKYKFFNSLFTGVGTGSYVTQYNPIGIMEIAIISIIFTCFSILIALYYQKLMYKRYFFIVALFVEIVMALWICCYLFFGISHEIALLIYMCRSITFVFGDFLSRCETYLFKKPKIFTLIDYNRQMGLIIGMIFAVVFYNILNNQYAIFDNNTLVYYIHFVLILIQVIIIMNLIDSFKKVRR